MEDIEGNDGHGFKTLTLDVQFYQSILDDVDISDAQKQELIETLWAIVVQFVDMGFGIHPLQQTNELTGRELDRPELHPSVTKMIAEAVNENADTTDNRLTGTLKEAWPEGSGS